MVWTKMITLSGFCPIWVGGVTACCYHKLKNTYDNLTLGSDNNLKMLEILASIYNIITITYFLDL